MGKDEGDGFFRNMNMVSWFVYGVAARETALNGFWNDGRE